MLCNLQVFVSYIHVQVLCLISDRNFLKAKEVVISEGFHRLNYCIDIERGASKRYFPAYIYQIDFQESA